MRKFIVLMVGLVLSVFSSGQAYATQYQLLDLGKLGGDKSIAYGINNHGQIVGESEYGSSSERHAFLYENGVMSDLGTIGGHLSSGAKSINDSGHIVGTLYDVSYTSFSAFLYENGSMRELGTLGGIDSIATAINNKGQIVGDSRITSGEMHAFLYENNLMSDLGITPRYGGNNLAQDINNLGQIVGSNGLYSSGLWSNLGFSATAINDLGQVVGYGVKWDGGISTDLGSLGGGSTVALGINENGQIVGESHDSFFHNAQAFIYEHDKMTALPNLGGNSSSATAINDLGQIVGFSYTNSGEVHAVQWQPIVVTPEPLSSTLFLLGGGSMIFFRRKD